MTEQVLVPARPLAEPPAGACRLYLIRHGTTTMNVENRYRGRRDIPLDAQGYQDAVDAARQLSGVGLSAVYTGPLRRTIATAQIIADEARVPDLRILHGLTNVDYGAWEGMSAEEAAMYDPEAFSLYRTSPSRAACPLGAAHCPNSTSTMAPPGWSRCQTAVPTNPSRPAGHRAALTTMGSSQVTAPNQPECDWREQCVPTQADLAKSRHRRRIPAADRAF